MKRFAEYYGKTVECLASGSEVKVEDYYHIMSNQPYVDSTFICNDEGEFVCLIQEGDEYAEIIPTDPKQAIVDYLSVFFFFF